WVQLGSGLLDAGLPLLLRWDIWPDGGSKQQTTLAPVAFSNALHTPTFDVLASSVYPSILFFTRLSLDGGAIDSPFDAGSAYGQNFVTLGSSGDRLLLIRTGYYDAVPQVQVLRFEADAGRTLGPLLPLQASRSYGSSYMFVAPHRLAFMLSLGGQYQ